MKSQCLLTTKICKATKMQKLGWFGGLWVNQGHRKHRHLIERIWFSYDFLFDFNRNYASILYRFRVIARFSSKVANFNPPHLHLSPRRGWSRLNFAVIFGVRKLESRGYLMALFVCFSHFDTIPECDRHTHTQTEGQTDDGIYRA